jgi:hypothetical protein
MCCVGVAMVLFLYLKVLCEFRIMYFRLYDMTSKSNLWKILYINYVLQLTSYLTENTFLVLNKYQPRELRMLKNVVYYEPQ